MEFFKLRNNSSDAHPCLTNSLKSIKDTLCVFTVVVYRCHAADHKGSSAFSGDFHPKIKRVPLSYPLICPLNRPLSLAIKGYSLSGETHGRQGTDDVLSSSQGAPWCT